MDEGLWVSADRTILVEVWGDGSVFVATRDAPDGIWGPPVIVLPEHVAPRNKQNSSEER